VIEDRFLRRPPGLGQVGATFTDDVHDYEMMKIRILNAGIRCWPMPASSVGGHHRGLHGDIRRSRPSLRKVQTSEIVPHVARCRA
jgi:mannitol 2-dehydrogenase